MLDVLAWKAGAAEEREAIVEWLKEKRERALADAALTDFDPAFLIDLITTAIEQGEHTKRRAGDV